MPQSPVLIAVVILGAALLVALVRSHHISTPDLIIFCAIVPSIILHEISHGWVALACGDDTAKRAGRLTFNPIAHVDPVGTIVVPAVMALSGIGFLAWAKPVPVNVARLRSPRNQGVLVSLAGPATNVVLAGLCALGFVAVHGSVPAPGTNQFTLAAEIFFYAGLVNVLLAMFNMIPLPPLDGSVLIERALPRAWWPGYLRFRQYTMPLLLVLVLLNASMHPGPLTWLYENVENWWFNLLVG